MMEEFLEAAIPTMIVIFIMLYIAWMPIKD
jgi:hypothetical protein